VVRAAIGASNTIAARSFFGRRADTEGLLSRYSHGPHHLPIDIFCVITNSMAKSIRANTKKKRGRGRPKTTGKGEMVGVRLHPDLLNPLDQWIADQPTPQPSRPDAVRKALHDWLSGLGLMAGDRPGRARGTQHSRARSAGMAAKAIDALTDQSAPAEDRASRKRRLLKGPKEFRDVRADQPKSRRPKE
jgi:hypothetical protein